MRRISILAALLIAPAHALAQSNQPQLPQTAQQATRPFKDATMTSVARLPEVSVLLSGTTGEKTVEANIGVALANFTLDGKLKGPLDDSAPDTNLATLTGLTNGTSFDIGLSYLHWEPNADGQEQNEICIEYNRSQAENLEAAQKIGKPGTTGGCSWSSLPADSFRQQYLQAGSRIRREQVCKQFALSMLHDPASFECSALNLPDDSLSARYDRLTNWGTPIQAGIRYTRGRKKFSWADAATGEAKSAIEDPWELAVGINYLLSTTKAGDIAVGAEYRRQSAFEEQPKRDVCLPMGAGSEATTCRALAFGQYTELRRGILTGIVRKWFGSVAIDIRYNWDATNRQQILETPIYFLSTEGKGLTGGIVPSWSTRDSDGEGGWAVRAFIGEVISIWPRAR